jgi:organic radical activating enzyme
MWSRHKYFCSKPFEWFEVTQLNNRGGVYLCCPSWLDTPIGNIRHGSVAEIWNSKEAQAIRASILDGSFRYCNSKKCAFLQTRSGPVQNVKTGADPRLKDIIRHRRTRLPYGPLKIICTYDQSCNLWCPTCRSGIILETESRKEILAIQHKIQEQALPQAELLYITGSGDPFGSPFFRKWLQSMRREEMPKVTDICLHTNGMLWTPEQWNKIPESIQWLVTAAEISIDAATAKVYAVNRRGGDFNKLLENLSFIASLREHGPIEWVKISMVVQENNFQEMPAFVRLGKQFRFDQVYFGQLVNWGTFTDAEFKKRAVHVPDHPRHKDFLKMLKSNIFDDPVSDLGNLSRFRNPSVSKRVSKGFKNLWTQTFP